MLTSARIFICLALFLVGVHGQPLKAPTTGDAPCEAEPGADSKDTVASAPDAEGYYSLFNGKDFTGWWQSCLTMHSGSDTNGAIFRVDTLEKAIYTTQRKSVIGGVLMTRKIFENYELVMDLWPDYGNDGGIFNRTTAAGVCYKTTLGYIGGNGMGGVWGEGGYLPRDYRPFYFTSREDLIQTVGASNSPNWTTITRKFQPETYGCASQGCQNQDWPRLWDIDGWNQFKLQFYGGVDGKDSIHSKTWFRKVGSDIWVPIMVDTTLRNATPPGYIGLQVHGGGRFGGPKGTWYRNLRWKPLDGRGNPIHPVSIGRKGDYGFGEKRLRGIGEEARIRIRPGVGFVAFETLDGARFDAPAVFDLQGRNVGTLMVEGNRATWNSPGRAGLFCLRMSLGGRSFSKVFVLE